MPSLERGLCLNGLLPIEYLKKLALDAMFLDFDPCLTFWVERAPIDALSTALAVPPTSIMVTCTTSYDWQAGWIIGKLGSIEQVRSRLNGKFSRDLVRGVAEGLGPPRMKDFYNDLVKLNEQIGGDRSISFNLAKEQTEFAKLAKTYIQNPTPVRLLILVQTREPWKHILIETKLFKEALNSASIDVRKMAWVDFDSADGFAFDSPELLPRLIEVAEGTLPNSDADEQRMVACAFEPRLFDWFDTKCFDAGETAASIWRVAPPLIPEEQLAVARICKAMREKLNALRNSAKDPAKENH